MPDVKCRVSKNHRCHETTETYDPNRTTMGHMLRLKEKYRKRRWTEFQKHACRFALVCPLCGTPYPTLSGKVRLHPPDEPVALVNETVDVPDMTDEHIKTRLEIADEPDVMAEAVERGILKAPEHEVIDPKVAAAKARMEKARATRLANIAAKKAKG